MVNDDDAAVINGYILVVNMGNAMVKYAYC